MVVYFIKISICFVSFYLHLFQATFQTTFISLITKILSTFHKLIKSILKKTKQKKHFRLKYFFLPIKTSFDFQSCEFLKLYKYDVRAKEFSLIIVQKAKKTENWCQLMEKYSTIIQSLNEKKNQGSTRFLLF